MLKLKVNLIIREIAINEEMCNRRKRLEEINIEREVRIMDNEARNYYEIDANFEDWNESITDISTLMEMEREFKARNGENLFLCYECNCPMDKNVEKEKFQEKGKTFNEICWDCEDTRSLNITDIEIITIEDSSDDEDVEMEGTNVINDEVETDEMDTTEENNFDNEVEEKKYSKNYWLLVKELSQENIEEDNEGEEIEEIERSNTQNISYYLGKISRNKRRELKLVYKLGEYYKNEVIRRMGRKKMDRKVRNEIHKEVARKRNNTVKNIGQELRRAERIYNLFKVIGYNKMKRLRNATYTTIMGCSDDEIGNLKMLFKEN